MYREMLSSGAYESAQEYDQILAFAREEFEEECIIDQIVYEQSQQDD